MIGVLIFGSRKNDKQDVALVFMNFSFIISFFPLKIFCDGVMYIDALYTFSQFYSFVTTVA